MKLKRVDWYPDCVRIITAQERGTNHMDQSLTHRDAARLLAGLEVALAAALREAGRGRCLRCGRVEEDICGYDTEQCHCTRCFGVLSPLPARGEGLKRICDTCRHSYGHHDSDTPDPCVGCTDPIRVHWQKTRRNMPTPSAVKGE